MFNPFTTIVLIQFQDPFIPPPPKKKNISMIGSLYALLSHYLHLDIFKLEYHIA